MQSSIRKSEVIRGTIPNWKIPWQDFSSNAIPRKGKPLIFVNSSGSLFIGKIDFEGLIQVSDSSYVYSKSESQISQFAYLENIRDGLILFPNRPDTGRLIIIKDSEGEFFLGKMNRDGLIERIGTGYQYSVRDSFLNSWIYASNPNNE